MASPLSIQITLAAIDRVTGPVKKIAQQFEQLKQRTQDYQSTLDKSLQRAANLSLIGASALNVGRQMSDALRQPIQVAAEFEAMMSKVQALTRLDLSNTGQRQQFDALRKQALDLGAQTSFSSNEAAGAQSFLAMAGFNPEAIMQTMPGMLSLAKAGGTELQRTADIASNVLSGFSMTADQMTRLGDVMTYAFTTSNVNLEMLGETMKYVAPIASKAGASIEQVAAMSGMLGDVGIQGSMAGTALRAAFIRLADPPKEAAKALKALGVSAKNSRGQMRSVTDTLLDLNKATSKLESGRKIEYISSIFGQEAAAAMMELVDKAEKLDNKFRDIEKNSAGVAEKVAKTMGDNYAGRVQEMDSALESLHITIGDLLMPTLKSKVELITQWISKAQQWIEQNRSLSTAIVDVAIKVAGGISALGGFALAVASIITPMAYLRFGISRTVGGLGLFKTAFLAVVGGLVGGLTNWQGLVTRFVLAWKTLQDIWAGESGWGISKLELFRRISMSAFNIDPIDKYRVAVSKVSRLWGETVGSMTSKIERSFPNISEWLGNKLPQASSRTILAWKTLQDNWAGESGWGVSKLELFRRFSMSAFNIDPIDKYRVAVSKVSRLWGSVVGVARSRTPAVNQAIASWLQSNRGKMQTVFTDGKQQVMIRLGVAIDWLNNKAKDGSLQRWLGMFAEKIKPVTKNMTAFGLGVLQASNDIRQFIADSAQFVGGWENMGKIFVGLALVSKFAALLSGLSSILTIIQTTGAIIWSTGAVFIAFGSWLAGTGIFATIAAKLMVVYRAIQLVGFALLMLGRMTLLNPIVLALSALAATAYVIYSNWSAIVNKWNNSYLKKIVMPILTTGIDYATNKWQQLKKWWNNATLAEKAFGIATAPLQIAKVLATDFFNWWKTTELGKKVVQIGTDTIDWARTKISDFVNWFNNLSLKTLAASVSSYTPPMTRSTFQAGHTAGQWLRDKLGFGGDRASGGSVASGHFYQVNELGPELLQMAGKSYLMMGGSAGKVIPLAANQASFTQAKEKHGHNVLPLQRRSSQHQTNPQQTITITINAAPGMDEQAIANVVVSKLREQHNRQRHARAGVMYDGDYL